MIFKIIESILKKLFGGSKRPECNGKMIVNMYDIEIDHNVHICTKCGKEWV